jgi:hypothetical protein
MAPSRHARAVVAAAAVAVLGGCPPRVAPPDLSLDPAALAGQVLEAQERVRSVRGEVRVAVDSKELSGTVPALVAAEKPDRVLVQTLDFFGNTVAVLAVAEGKLTLYDARARVVYRGPATPENLARLVPLPISPAALVAILCGSAPLIRGEPVSAEPGHGWVTLRITGGARTEDLRVGKGADVLRASIRAGGTPGPGSYDLEFGAFDALEGIHFPAEVSLSAESPRVRMKITWTEAEPNATLGPKTFAPRIPASARVVELGEAAPPVFLAPPDAPRPKE